MPQTPSWTSYAGPPRWRTQPGSTPDRLGNAPSIGEDADVKGFNATVVEDFRANGGRVGRAFEGAPLTLVHHQGRRSGRKFVSPMMYMPDDQDPDTIYVFASKGGAPSHPDWYHNLTAAGAAEVEVGTERYPVTVTEVTGADRDRIYAGNCSGRRGDPNVAAGEFGEDVEGPAAVLG